MTNDFSAELLHSLRSASITPPLERPRLLMEPDDVIRVRERAEAVPGILDRVAEQAKKAAVDERYFSPQAGRLVALPAPARCPQASMDRGVTTAGRAVRSSRPRSSRDVFWRRCRAGDLLCAKPSTRLGP